MDVSSQTTAQTDPTPAPEAKYPLVSVIMPSYNTSLYIQEAIDSVLSQDYPNKELIIIDDGSTDNTVDLIRAYGERVTLLTQKNQGSAVARNAGIAAARGEYIAFLDSDDVWLPGKLSTQVRYLEQQPGIGMIYGRWHVWKPQTDGHFAPANTIATESTEPIRLVEEGSGWLYNRLLFTSLLHTITVMARRSLIDEVGSFDVDLKRGQDYDYWIRASRVTQIHQLDQVLALYRLHGEGCAKKWPHVNYEKVVIENALSRWGGQGPTGDVTAPSEIEHRLSEICFSFGYHHFWEGSPRLALKSFAESLKHRPSHLTSWRYLALSAVKTITRPSGQQSQ